MKCKIPEISWHNRDPVLSVDIQSKSGLPNTYRLASGGTDAHVLLWHMTITSDGSDIELDLAADLTRHQRAVNAVKWSSKGELLASGDDESVVFIWKQKAESDAPNILDITNDQDKEVWITLKVLRGHMEDVYDLSWAPNSQFLVSGSVDNSAIIWDVHKGKSLAILNDHKGFVQGVAWDPKNQYIATLSTDRYLRIFDIQTKRVLHRINKGVLPVAEEHELHGRRMRLFHDDTLQTFFRRLCFTPDGKLLLTPAGVTDYEGVTRPLHTTYAFSRYGLRQPTIVLPCPDQYAVAVRCCSLLYRLRSHNAATNPPVVPLPYRMIFAVATRSSVYFYDTQQRQPFAVISNIHYTRLTDACWSSDGRIVVVSSTDGFCSLITFEPGELGEEYEDAEAVLGAALAPDVRAVSTKKPKKQKENTRKSSTDELNGLEKTLANVVREPLLEKVIEGGAQQMATEISIKKNEDSACGAITTDTTPKTPIDNINSDNVVKSNVADATTPLVALTTKPTLPIDIVIDKEIIRSDEKFETPEKKCRSATPINVRRHPRTPSGNAAEAALAISPTPTSKLVDCVKNTTEAQNSPLSSLKQQNTASPRRIKPATPIAVRRTPRALVAPTLLEKTAPIIPTEEAMDAWPLPEEKEEETHAATVTAQAVEVSFVSESIGERTEDIHLVYEDTVEEAKLTETVANSADPADEKQRTVESAMAQVNEPEVLETASLVNAEVAAPRTKPAAADDDTLVNTPKQKEQTPNNKTPRRVALKTISTPKSKKKLLN